jgi:hypothetical protein
MLESYFSQSNPDERTAKLPRMAANSMMLVEVVQRWDRDRAVLLEGDRISVTRWQAIRDQAAGTRTVVMGCAVWCCCWEWQLGKRASCHHSRCGHDGMMPLLDDACLMRDP